jgi:hypothetical protein
MTGKFDSEDANPEFKHICTYCKIALKPAEVGGYIEGQFADYMEGKEIGEIGFNLCTEHWAILMDGMGIDMTEAIARRRVMESMMKEADAETLYLIAISQDLSSIHEIDDMIGDLYE